MIDQYIIKVSVQDVFDVDQDNDVYLNILFDDRMLKHMFFFLRWWQPPVEQQIVPFSTKLFD